MAARLKKISTAMQADDSYRTGRKRFSANLNQQGSAVWIKLVLPVIRGLE